MSLLTDMTREIAGLRHCSKVEIQMGSLDGLTSAINRAVGLKTAEPKGVADLTFAGIKVIENDILGPNTAVVLSDGKIINIINFG